MKLMNSNWWKWLCIALLLYVVAGGMLVPLSPGIISISPYYLKSDSIQNFEVVAHNTHFVAEMKSLQVFVKSGSEFYCVNDWQVLDEDHLSFSWGVNRSRAAQLPSKHLDLIINNRLDGNVTLREAMVLTGDVVADSTPATPVICEPVVNNNHSQGFGFPFREILYESIRNTFYHVPMWFSMLLLLLVSLICSVRFLATGDMRFDVYAAAFVNVGLLFGVLGLVTGMIWATYTWGSPWPNDPKLNGAAIGMAIYLAYAVLRASVPQPIKRGRITAVYNIFAFVIFVLFIFIMPRLTDSLHPGNGGNPAFSKYDLDSHMRLFFYPAVIGWVLLGCWFTSLHIRIQQLENRF